MTDRLGAVVETPPGWLSGWNDENDELVVGEPLGRLPPGAFADLMTVRPIAADADPAGLADRALWLMAEQTLERVTVLDRGPAVLGGCAAEHVLLHGYAPGPYALLAEAWWVREGGRAWCLLGLTVPLLYAVGGPLLERVALSFRPA